MRVESGKSLQEGRARVRCPTQGRGSPSRPSGARTACVLRTGAAPAELRVLGSWTSPRRGNAGGRNERGRRHGGHKAALVRVEKQWVFLTATIPSGPGLLLQGSRGRGGRWGRETFIFSFLRLCTISSVSSFSSLFAYFCHLKGNIRTRVLRKKPLTIKRKNPGTSPTASPETGLPSAAGSARQGSRVRKALGIPAAPRT